MIKKTTQHVYHWVGVSEEIENRDTRDSFQFVMRYLQSLSVKPVFAILFDQVMVDLQNLYIHLENSKMGVSVATDVESLASLYTELETLQNEHPAAFDILRAILIANLTHTLQTRDRYLQETNANPTGAAAREEKDDFNEIENETVALFRIISNSMALIQDIYCIAYVLVHQECTRCVVHVGTAHLLNMEDILTKHFGYNRDHIRSVHEDQNRCLRDIPSFRSYLF